MPWFRTGKSELGSEAERSFRAQRREDPAGSCQGQPGPDCRLYAEKSELGVITEVMGFGVQLCSDLRHCGSTFTAVPLVLAKRTAEGWLWFSSDPALCGVRRQGVEGPCLPRTHVLLL